jgi:multiple sugar transport system ATP-binding protein
MNLIPGVARGGMVEADGLSLPGATAADGQRAVWGVRPEHLDLSDAGIPATVVVVEPTGSETHVVLRIGGHDAVAVFRERHAFRPGEVIHLAPREGLVHLFDEASGMRINQGGSC